MPALQNNLTEGSVSRKLIRYAMPLVASSLLQAIYSITDIIIAGHFIGDNGISAINTSSVIMNMLTHRPDGGRQHPGGPLLWQRRGREAQEGGR